MILKNNKRIDGCSDTVPIGTLNPFLGSTAPYGYLLCQGQKVSKTTYKELYEICGTTFGPETSTEFTLPDLRGQTIAGYKEGDSIFGTLGGLIGSLTHSHSTGNHTLTIDEMPSHTHARGTMEITGTFGITTRYNSADMNGRTSGAFKFNHEDGKAAEWAQSNPNDEGGSVSFKASDAWTGESSQNGDSQPHNHGDTSSTSSVQPTIVLNWIVKAFQLMPNQSYVENSLESDSTINSLSAAKGKELNKKFTDYATKSEMIQYLPLNGGTMKGEIITGQGDGYGIQLGANGRVNATLDGKTNATVLGILDASVIVGHTSSPLLLRGSDNALRYNGVALVESGNNSNGSYIKLIDGTMICYHTKNINVACTSQWGQLYEGGAAIGNLPSTFTSTPIVMVTNTAPDGYFEGIRDTTKSTWGTLRMAIPTSSTRTFKINLLAIGRWK